MFWGPMLIIINMFFVKKWGAGRGGDLGFSVPYVLRAKKKKNKKLKKFENPPQKSTPVQLSLLLLPIVR